MAQEPRHILGWGRSVASLEDVVEEQKVHGEETDDQENLNSASHASIVEVSYRGPLALHCAGVRQCHSTAFVVVRQSPAGSKLSHNAHSSARSPSRHRLMFRPRMASSASPSRRALAVNLVASWSPLWNCSSTQKATSRALSRYAWMSAFKRLRSRRRRADVAHVVGGDEQVKIVNVCDPFHTASKWSNSGCRSSVTTTRSSQSETGRPPAPVFGNVP